MKIKKQIEELNALLSKKVSQNEGFEVVYEMCEMGGLVTPLDGKMVFRLIKWMPIVKATETYEEMVSFIENDFNPKKYK